MIYKEGTQLFVGGDIPEHMEEAKKYIARHSLTWDDVKLVRKTCGETGRVDIVIIAKREVTIRGK